MVSFARASWHAAPMLLAWASLAWGAGPDLSPYQDSLKARHFEEVERLAHERLQSTPHDVSAMLAEAIAIIDMLDSARYANAEANLNACISGDPSAAICQTWLGRVL